MPPEFVMPVTGLTSYRRWTSGCTKWRSSVGRKKAAQQFLRAIGPTSPAATNGCWLRLQNAELEGVVDRLAAVAGIEFRVDVAQVGLDGLGRDEQPLGNLLVAHSPCEQLDDLDLAGREELNERGDGGRRDAGFCRRVHRSPPIVLKGREDLAD